MTQAGVYGLDTHRAYSDLATQLSGDGLHPSATGHAAQAAYIKRALFDVA